MNEPTIGAESIAQSLAGAHNCCTDESMHREAADCEAVHPRTHPVDIDEEDECAGLVQARIPGDAPKIGRNADGRCGARVKSGQRRGVQRYEVVVSDQTGEHVG